MIIFKKRNQECSGEMATPAVLAIPRKGIGGSIPSTAKETCHLCFQLHNSKKVGRPSN